jgi:hypothetical protein
MTDIPAQIAPAIAPRAKPPRKSSKPKRKPKSATKARKRRLDDRRKFFLDLRRLPDEAVLTIPEWQALNTLSEQTAKRILNSDDGPDLVRLSARRCGITMGANRAWQQRRTR